MFDLNDDKSTRVIEDHPEARMPVSAAAQERQQNSLDSDDSHHLHGKLMDYYRQEIDRQERNRFQMAVDEDFYDHIQWNEEDVEELKERGQAPLVYNVIAQSVNWIIGSEKRGRTDFKVLPRGKEDAKAAEHKTKLLKYLGDVNRTPFHRSRAFEDAAKVGIGWLEDGVTDDDDGEPIYSRYESWRNILWDSSSIDLSLEDCRYIFRMKWLDEDVAVAMFPNRRYNIHQATVDGMRVGIDNQNGDEVMDQPELERDTMMSVTNTRRRVRLIEAWFRKPVTVKKILGGAFQGEIYDEGNPAMAEAVQAGHAIIADRLMMRMHCAVMTTTGLLYVGESPYRHNKFPFTPVWCFRRGRDGLPYGYIRGMRDIQEDINKRASKALFILSTNKVVMDEGAVDDIEEFRKEVARPDAIIQKKAGKVIDLSVDRDLSAAHLQLMSQSINMIQTISGVTDELLGRKTNATSGKAIEARQEQGSLATSKIFDNLRLASQLQGEKQLSLVEQFFSEEKQFRITNERGTPEFVQVNDGLPENDITRTKADYVIAEGDWRATYRQAAAAELLQAIQTMPPQVGLVLLDLAVENMDLPNRDEIVKRIRQVTGMRDPDQEEPTEEEKAAMQAQQQQQQMQMEMFMAELRGKVADAAKKEADAQKAMASVEQILADVIGKNVTTHKEAVLTAREALLTPAVVPVADGILAESGWKDQVPGQIPVPQQPAPAAPAQPPVLNGTAQPL